MSEKRGQRRKSQNISQASEGLALVKTVYSRYSIYFYYLVQGIRMNGRGPRKLNRQGKTKRNSQYNLPRTGRTKKNLPWAKTHARGDLTVNSTLLV
jgi:hypothetical protein